MPLCSRSPVCWLFDYRRPGASAAETTVQDLNCNASNRYAFSASSRSSLGTCVCRPISRHQDACLPESETPCFPIREIVLKKRGIDLRPGGMPPTSPAITCWRSTTCFMSVSATTWAVAGRASAARTATRCFRSLNRVLDAGGDQQRQWLPPGCCRLQPDLSFLNHRSTHLGSDLHAVP